MNYQERVRTIAEKMAQDSQGKYWQNASQLHKDWLIKNNISKAHIAVAEMAEAYLWACKSTADASVIRAKMIGLGLIPDAQEGGSDETPAY